MQFSSLFTLFLFCVACVSCGSHSIEDFREEGRATTLSLTQELRQVHSRTELVACSNRLKQLFNDLVDTMIAAHEHHEREKTELSQEDHEVSDQLRAELNRIYRIEGAKEVIEKCQEAALHRLDAYEKRLAKRKRT